VSEKTVYFVAAGDPNLYAADRLTGKMLWQMDTGDWLASGPVLVGGLLYLAAQDGMILAYRE
jgi:outer membrane protein assembly factor BamB